MSTIPAITAALVQRGWHRDYSEVATPCWYLLSDMESDGETPAVKAPEAETLAIWPPAPCPWALYLAFNATGHMAAAQVVVHDSPGPRADGNACSIHEWPGSLDELLVQAEEVYQLWERWAAREAHKARVY